MRYIHDGELHDEAVEPRTLFIVDEANTPATGRTDTALETARLADCPAKQRTRETTPLLIGHDPSRGDFDE